MPLNLRAHSVNCFAHSKLLYRCNVIDIRVQDSVYFTSQAKTYLYADLFEKPEQKILYRKIQDGGLGLYNIQIRSFASLMSTFLQSAINPNFCTNYFHQTLFRCYVLGESLPKPNIPPNFSGTFFPILRKMQQNLGDLRQINLKGIYQYLMDDELCGEQEEQEADLLPRLLLPLRCELAMPTTDWPRTWSRARLRGLGPELSSYLLKMLWGILPTKKRLHHLHPRSHPSPYCQLCRRGQGEQREVESLHHALLTCPANHNLPQLLLTLLRSYYPTLQVSQVLTLDFDCDGTMELPLTWVVGTLLYSLWQQRVAGRVCPTRTRSDLEARCRLLREGKVSSLQNAFTLSDIALHAMFS